MSRSIADIITDLDAFQPIDDNWLPLDDLIAEAVAHADAMRAFPALLGVFVRFPDDDGAGVFWSIVHGLEAFPGYEQFVVDAVRECPTEMALTMVNRMLNSSHYEVGGTSLVALLKSVGENPAWRDRVRAVAARFADRHSD